MFNGFCFVDESKVKSKYCLIGLASLDHVEDIKNAILNLRIRLSKEDENVLCFRAYLDDEDVPQGWRTAITRIGNKSYQNKTLFPEGMWDFLKMHFDPCSFGPDDWKIVEVRDEKSPVTVKLSGNPKFQEAIDSLPNKTMAGTPYPEMP